jgi:Short C-terminal domain
LCTLRNVIFDGGSHSGSLTNGHYDLRFQDDRIMACLAGSAHAVVELPYADVEAVEVSRSAGQPASVPLGLISGFGLLGALLGYLFLQRLGILIGAVVLGLVGGLIAAGMIGTDTIVRIRLRDAEWQFRSPERPDDVRRALSEPLTAIRQASAARSDGHAEPPPDSVADELAKLASLLQQNLITRAEFDQLKARLIT